MLKTFQNYHKIVVAFSVVYLLLALFYVSHPQVVLTHYHNSEVTYLKARDMVRGDHQWGMFFDGPDHRTPRYEFHMPEGPTYVMAAWMKLGLPIAPYRGIPIGTSWLAHVIFLLAILHRYGHKVGGEKIGLLFSWVAFQPMIVAWSNAVDDGSFNVSLMVLLASCALFQWRGRWWGYLILGFMLGCQEFFRQPMMIIFLWFVEVLVHYESDRNTLKAFSKGFVWASIAGIGVFAGLLAHIGQLALVWGSWHDAWNEMAGAALGRASIQNDLNPAFFNEKLHDQMVAGAPIEWVRLKTMAKILKCVFWYDHGRQYVWTVVFAAGLCWAYCKNAGRAFALTSLLKPFNMVTLAFLFLIPNVWTLMMPNHASVHYYYIARDYIGYCWALALFLVFQWANKSEASVALKNSP